MEMYVGIYGNGDHIHMGMGQNEASLRLVMGRKNVCGDGNNSHKQRNVIYCVTVAHSLITLTNISRFSTFYHRCCILIHQPSTACSTSLPAQHLGPSGFFNCRPHSLELSPGFHPRPDHQFGLFQTAA